MRWNAPIEVKALPPRSFAKFWPHYVLAHRHPARRAFHFAGRLAAWGLLVAAILLRNPWLGAAALLLPYALAWFSHFFVEHNRPAHEGEQEAPVVFGRHLLDDRAGVGLEGHDGPLRRGLAAGCAHYPAMSALVD